MDDSKWFTSSGSEGAAPLACVVDFSLTIRIFAPLRKPAVSRQVHPGVFAMAKPASIKIRLNSTADTGFFYVTKKNPRTQTEKMSFRKYDPKARKHVEFKEAKIK